MLDITIENPVITIKPSPDADEYLMVNFEKM